MSLFSSMDFSGCFDSFNFSHCIHDLQRAHRINSLHVICFIFHYLLVCNTATIKYSGFEQCQSIISHSLWADQAQLGCCFVAHGIGWCHLYTICFRSQSSAGTGIGYRRHASLFSSLRPHFLRFLGQPPQLGTPQHVEMEVASFLGGLDLDLAHYHFHHIVLFSVSHEFQERGSKCHSSMEWGACIFRDGRNY